MEPFEVSYKEFNIPALTKVCKYSGHAGQVVLSDPGRGLQQQEMEASRQESFGKKAGDVSTLFVQPPSGSTASCLHMRHPVVSKEWSEVPVFTGPQLLR